jgi:hypothetical protein
MKKFCALFLRYFLILIPDKRLFLKGKLSGSRATATVASRVAASVAAATARFF